MLRSTKTIDKYLARQCKLPAFSEASARFDSAIVVPVCSEPSLTPWITPLPNALYIFVFNDNGTAAKAQNEQTHRSYFNAPMPPVDVGRWCGNALTINGGSEIGVGGARKIGCDVALSLWRHGVVRSPWLHNTDADAELSPDHVRPPSQTSGAVCHAFRHQGSESPLHTGHLLYEIHMRLFVCGLMKAKSPFAFHTIGSTISVHAVTYAQVRGFPKRDAGEDFHFLNKVRKVAPVSQRCHPTVTLKIRESNRTPFGTAISAQEIIQQGVSNFTVPHPHQFERLQQIYGLLHDGKISELAPLLPAALVEQLKNSKRPMLTFDALKTRRFVLQAPKIPLVQALEYWQIDSSDSIDSLRENVAECENALRSTYEPFNLW